MSRMLHCFLAGLAFAPIASPAVAQTFDLVDLGTIPGTTFSAANAMNEQDVIVGRSGNAGERLFLWDPVSGLRDLASPYPLYPYQAVRMNQAVRLAGLWERGGVLRPFTWANGTFTEQPDVSPGWTRMIRRITDGGLVHYQGARAPCNLLSAVLFGGVAYRVEQVLGNCWSAIDISDGPVVAGYRLNGADHPAVVRQADGREVVVSPLANATVYRIGPGGHYAGQNWTSTRMFLSSPGGGYAEWAPLPGTTTIFPEGLNRLGEIVGGSYYPSTGSGRPFLIRAGRMMELASTVPGFVITDVIDVNDQGHIAGQARLPNGQLHAVLLRPTDRTQNLRASVAGNAVTLTWTPPAAAPAGATYHLQVGSVPGGSNVFEGNIGGVTAIGGAVPNGAYHARVAMVYPSGAVGALSAELAFTVPAAPQPPVGLAFSLNGRTLGLSWLAPPGGGVVDYVVEAGSAPGAVDLYNGPVGASTAVAAVVPPRVYFIRVRARNAGGVSAPSNEVIVHVP